MDNNHDPIAEPATPSPRSITPPLNMFNMRTAVKTEEPSPISNCDTTGSSLGTDFPAIEVVKEESEDSDFEEMDIPDDSGDSDEDAAFDQIVLAATATAKAQVLVRNEIKQEFPDEEFDDEEDGQMSGEIPMPESCTPDDEDSRSDSLTGSLSPEQSETSSLIVKKELGDLEQEESPETSFGSLERSVFDEIVQDEIAKSEKKVGKKGRKRQNCDVSPEGQDETVPSRRGKGMRTRGKRNSGPKKGKIKDDFGDESDNEAQTRPGKKRGAKSESTQRGGGTVTLRGRDFQCWVCKQKCTSQKSLEKHMDLAHSGFTEEESSELSETEAEKKEAASAFSSDSVEESDRPNNPDLVCEECGKQCVTSGGLAQHRFKHMSKEDREKLRIHECSLCDQKFTLFTTLLRHQQAKHESTPCLKEKRVRAATEGNKVKKYKCSQCDTFLCSTSDLDNHYKTVHGLDLDGKVFLCRYCDKRFKQPNLLSQHENVHLNLQPYVCHICDSKRFNSREAFRRHKLDCQARLEGKEHQCPYCDASYTARNSMLAHIRNLHGARTRCKKCSRVLSSERALVKHLQGCKGRNLKSTSNKKGSVRPDYLKPYWNQMELLQYRVAGQVQKKTIYRCVRCKAEGNSRAEVANHIVAVHQPELLHCDLCGKNFATIGKVTSHRRVCQKRMCPHCGEIFCSIQYTRFHVANAKCLEKPDRSETWKIRKLVKRHQIQNKPGSDEEVEFIDA